jgi:hypothetical protein
MMGVLTRINRTGTISRRQDAAADNKQITSNSFFMQSNFRLRSIFLTYFRTMIAVLICTYAHTTAVTVFVVTSACMLTSWTVTMRESPVAMFLRTCQ